MILQPDLNLPRGDFDGSEIAKKSFGEVKIDSKKASVDIENMNEDSRDQIAWLWKKFMRNL